MRWFKRRWLLWRLRPGLRIAETLAYDRAWSKHGGELGPEMNLINLSNDLGGFRLRLELDQERLGPEFERVLYEQLWGLYAR